MQISPKARLISIIVAVVFMFGALTGTGTYLIVNHLNNVNATTSTNYITTTNLFNTNGTINPIAADTLLEAVGYYDHSATRTGYKAHQIRTRNSSSSYNGDRTIIFPMGYYNGTDIYWQATYLYNNYLTIWMVKGYTTSTWNSSSVTVNYSSYANSTVQNYLDNTLWGRLTQNNSTLRSIFALPSTVGYQSTSSTNTTYCVSNFGYGFYATYNNLASAVATGSYLWLPSFGEVCNNTSNDFTNSTRSYTGQWGLNTTDRAFSSRNYDGSSAGGSCWLRSGYSTVSNSALLVISSGDNSVGDVSLSGGVRPAAHLSLSALEDAIPPQYTISVRSNNTSYGTVSISPSGGTYYQGTTLTVTATPASGYRFVRWERNGTQVSKSASYTFTVSSSTSGTYTAIFEPATATISTAVSPTGTGTATGGGTYNINSQATLSATPASGYKFVGWQLNGAIVSTSASYTFTVSSSTSGTYTAIFEPATYTVIMETSGYPSLVGGLAGGFENTGWNGTYGTEHVRSGSYSLKITANTSTPEVTIPTTTAVPIVVDNIDKRNHVYYFQYWGYQETRAGASTQIYWPIEEPSMGSIALGPAGRWNMYSFYGTRSNNSTTTSSVRIDFDNANQAGTIWFDDFLMLDLTDIFGAGNEPSKEWCDMHIISGTNTQTFIENISAALETRPGGDSTIYTFAGWSTTPKTTNTTNQTVQYSNGGTVNNLTNAGGSITLYGVWEYRPFARASATLGGEVRVTGNDLGTGTTSATVSYEAIPYTGYYLIGWYVGDMLYTENGTTYTGTTLTLPRATAEGVAVVPVFSLDASATPSLSFDLDNNTAITASIGGEARIIGDTYSTTDTVTLIATVQMQGYRFVGWYIDGIQVSTDETTILSRATVLGKIVQARFAPIDNSTTNDDTDNTQTDDFVFF